MKQYTMFADGDTPILFLNPKLLYKFNTIQIKTPTWQYLCMGHLQDNLKIL